MAGAAPAPRLEIAHVLFMDIVSYSRMPMDQQQQSLHTLQRIVRESAEFSTAETSGQLIRLPTGDGMALVFFGDPEAPVRCAVQIATELRHHPEIPMRIGVHTGPVYRVEDINANRNVAGGGINMAQRVMDCGDAGHILLSKAVADVLHQIGRWHDRLHPLGEAQVKHGVRLQIVNLYDTEVGNPKLPSKLRKAQVRRVGKRSVIAFAALLLVAAATLAYVLSHRRQLAADLTKIGRVQARRSIAVLGFQNLTGRPDAAWLSTALSQMLTTELAAGEKLRTVPGEDVARMKIDLGLPEAASLNKVTLLKVGKAVDADLVVLGSYVALSGGQLRLDVRLQDVISGDTVAQDGETGTETNLFDLVSKAGGLLRRSCGIADVTGVEAAGVKASLPSNSEATRLYAEGLAKLRTFDALGARDLLQKAIEADSGYALAHSALGAAWSALGYDEKAREEAKSAFDLSGNLSREDKLLVEGRYRETSKEWGTAGETYRTLYGFFPDNLDYGLALARVQARGGQLEGASKTLERLRTLPPPLNDDPRIDLEAARTEKSIGHFKQAQELAGAGAQKARAKNSKLLLARARYVEGLALKSLGKPHEAMVAAQEAQRLYDQAGDRNGVASGWEVIGEARAGQGDFQGALHAYQQELAIVRAVGNERAVASALNNMAFVLSQLGEEAEVKRSYDEAIATFRKIGDKVNISPTLLNLGGVLAGEGEFNSAKQKYEEALAIAREIGSQNNIALSLGAIGSVQSEQADFDGAIKSFTQALTIALENGNKDVAVTQMLYLADVYMHRGDLKSAKGRFDDALALAKEMDNKSAQAEALAGLGDISLAGSDLDAARRQYSQALELRKQDGEKKMVASSQVKMAGLMLEQGQPAEAESTLRAAVNALKGQEAEDEAATQVILLRALIAQGKNAEALRLLTGLGKFAHGQNQNVQVEFSIAAAQVKAANGQLPVAVPELKSAMLAAGKYGMAGSRLEAALYLGRAQIQAGKKDEGRALLAQTEKEAAAQGFTLLAHKAAAEGR